MSDWREDREVSLGELLAKKERELLQPKTANQKIYLDALERATVTLCTGPAGSGKSFCACGKAAQMLKSGKVAKIIITRPLVPCGKGYGFRPGTTFEKVSPDMRPMLDALEIFLTRRGRDKLIESGDIELLPLDDMRGCSLPKAMIICDEAQNATFNQLHMLLTRFGEGSKVVVMGDVSPTQTDLNHDGENPLKRVIERFQRDCNKDVAIVGMTRKDIVRHPLIQWIDERLTSPLPLSGEVWGQARCPGCRETMWFEDGAAQDDGVAECWQCKAMVELYDDAGILDPLALDDFVPDEDEPAYRTFPQRP